MDKRKVNTKGEMKYKLICEEEIVGSGDICWHGNKEYLFDGKEEVLKFMEERLPLEDLNNPIYEEDGKQTGQYLVTHSITINTIQREGQKKTKKKENDKLMHIEGVGTFNVRNYCKTDSWEEVTDFIESLRIASEDREDPFCGKGKFPS